MAEYVSNNEELQKEEESSVFTLSAIWTIIVLNWQWIVLSTFIALLLHWHVQKNAWSAWYVV